MVWFGHPKSTFWKIFLHLFEQREEKIRVFRKNPFTCLNRESISGGCFSKILLIYLELAPRNDTLFLKKSLYLFALRTGLWTPKFQKNFIFLSFVSNKELGNFRWKIKNGLPKNLGNPLIKNILFYLSEQTVYGHVCPKQYSLGTS